MKKLILLTLIIVTSVLINAQKLPQNVIVKDSTKDVKKNFVKQQPKNLAKIVFPNKNKIEDDSTMYAKILSEIKKIKQKNTANITKIKLLKNTLSICKIVEYDTVGKLCPPQKLKIDKISISFENGIIKDIYLVGKIGDKPVAFTNEYSIKLRTANDYRFINASGENFLESKISNVLSYKIDVSDILFFARQLHNASGVYVPIDTVITLNAGEEDIFVELKRKSVIDNLDFKIYTDVTGFNTNSKNGKFQIELSYNLFTQTFVNGNFVLIDHVSPFLHLSRIGDNTNIKLSADPAMLIDNKLVVNQFDLVKYSYLNSGINANIFQFNYPASFLSLNFIGGVYITTIDTIITGTDFLQTAYFDDISSYFIGLELNYLLFDIDNLSLSFKGNWYYTTHYSKSIEIINNLKPFFSFLVDLNYYPNSENKSTALFFRSRFYKQSENDNINFEIGSKFPLSKLLGTLGI